MQASQYDKTISINGEDILLRTEYVGADEYIDFLRRSDLGKQYPKEDFKQRITELVKNVQISLIARNGQNQIVGICFGITDFVYWLMITDLGVDRAYEKRGLGKGMMEVAHELAGGEKNIILFAYANDSAIPFYKKIGMRKTDSMMIKDNIEWTEFVVE